MQATEKPLAAKQPVLIMIQGPEPGSLCKLPDNRVTTIGRSSRNTVRAVSPNVSRFHCEIACVNGEWELNDLNSKKGTMVNGQLIAGRCVLTPGDIIRVGSTVFRFDVIDETALRDGAMVAIMEAELDQRLLTKGEATGSLEDIRARSRLEGEQARQERWSQRRVLRLNVAFLGVVAAAVGIIVTAILVYAHANAAPRDDAGSREERARLQLDRALAALKAGQEADALQRLLGVQTSFPQTQAAREAARVRVERLWSAAEDKLALVAQREAEGDFAAALRLYDELAPLGPDQLLQDLLQERRGFTVRLAHASFKALSQEADRRAGAGDVQGALDLYRQARDAVGLPELAAQADAKIAELEQSAAQ